MCANVSFSESFDENGSDSSEKCFGVHKLETRLQELSRTQGSGWLL